MFQYEYPHLNVGVDWQERPEQHGMEEAQWLFRPTHGVGSLLLISASNLSSGTYIHLEDARANKHRSKNTVFIAILELQKKLKHQSKLKPIRHKKLYALILFVYDENLSVNVHIWKSYLSDSNMSRASLMVFSFSHSFHCDYIETAVSQLTFGAFSTVFTDRITTVISQS